MVRKKHDYVSYMLQKRIFLLFYLIAFSSIGSGFGQSHRFSYNGEEFWEYYKIPYDDVRYRLSATHYDYSGVATTLTRGCENDFQKIRAIYRWMCRNIVYDTSHDVRTADKCYDQKRGVCQGFCELFCRIAEAANVKVEIVTGKSKDLRGVVSGRGHAWLFAYTRENYGILLDPTWGAIDESSWLGVSAEWLLFTHFPDDETYQFVEKPMSFPEFVSLMPSRGLWPKSGFDVHNLLIKARMDSLSLPLFYDIGSRTLEIIDIPIRSTLRVGDTYTFRLKTKRNRGVAIVNNDVWAKTDRWTKSGDDEFSIDFMVIDTVQLALCIENDDKDLWNICMAYAIESPSEEDWEKVEKDSPLSLPEARKVKNLDADSWRECDVDERELLRLIRRDSITELPIVFTELGQKLRIQTVPMSKTLYVGKEYTFSFYPQSGVNWAIINEGEWLTDWELTEDGMYSQTISPEKPGLLKLSVQLEQGGSYWGCLRYEVK